MDSVYADENDDLSKSVSGSTQDYVLRKLRLTYPEICGKEVFDLEWLHVKDFPAIEEHDQKASYQAKDSREWLSCRLVWVGRRRAVIDGILQTTIASVTRLRPNARRNQSTPKVKSDECKTLRSPH